MGGRIIIEKKKRKRVVVCNTNMRFAYIMHQKRAADSQYADTWWMTNTNFNRDANKLSPHPCCAPFYSHCPVRVQDNEGGDRDRIKQQTTKDEEGEGRGNNGMSIIVLRQTESEMMSRVQSMTFTPL